MKCKKCNGEGRIQAWSVDEGVTKVTPYVKLCPECKGVGQERGAEMITFLPDADIFEIAAEVIVNPVNEVGIMGAGLALEFKKRYPAYFEAYREACRHSSIAVGEMHYYYCTTYFVDIISSPTKQTPAGSSLIEWIESGMKDLAHKLKNRGISSIAIPKLGCGLGGLDWKEVCPLIVAALEGIDCDVYILGGDVR